VPSTAIEQKDALAFFFPLFIQPPSVNPKYPISELVIICFLGKVSLRSFFYTQFFG
jgi:hypothetical protein